MAIREKRRNQCRLLWLPCLLWLSLTSAVADGDAAWQRGQAVYRNGWNGQAACIRCHGTRGEGREEGGLRAPAMAGESDRRYLLRAMSEGLGRAGQTLHPLMPRYQIDAATLDDLLAYLKVIGQDTPGLSDAVLRIGVVLPDTAYSAAIQAGLHRAFDQVVYGRRLQLMVNPLPGEVFVEVANLQLDMPPDGESEGSSAPLIGPLPPPDQANFSDILRQDRFHLLPSAHEQVSALLAQVAIDMQGSKTAKNLRLIHDAGNDPDLLLQVNELRRQARSMHHTLREQAWPAKTSMPDEAIIFLGSGAHLLDFLKTGGSSLVYVNAIQVGSSVWHLPPAQAARLRLLLPWHTADATFDLATAYGDAAYAAGMVLIETLKRCGRQLDRPHFLQQLANLRDFPAQGLGTITYRPDQHHGSHGGQLLEMDASLGLFRVLRSW